MSDRYRPPGLPGRPGLPAPLHSPRPRGCRAAPAPVSGPRRRLLLFLSLLFLLQPRPPARGLPCPGLRGAQPAGPPHRREPQGDGAAPARRLRPPPPHRAGPPPSPAPEPRGEQGSPAGTGAHGRRSHGCGHAPGCAMPPAPPRDALPLAPGAAPKRGPSKRLWDTGTGCPGLSSFARSLLAEGDASMDPPAATPPLPAVAAGSASVATYLWLLPPTPPFLCFIARNLTLPTTMASVKHLGLVPLRVWPNTGSFCTVCSLSLPATPSACACLEQSCPPKPLLLPCLAAHPSEGFPAPFSRPFTE